MRTINVFITILTFITALFFLCQCRHIVQPDEYYCTLIAGEPTQTTVILEARLHKTDTLINNDIQGIEGFIKFVITREKESENQMESNFFHASDSIDYIAKYEFTGLRPGQQYFYRISYGKDTSNVTRSPWKSFKTLNLASSDKSVDFAIVSGMNYSMFGAVRMINYKESKTAGNQKKFSVFSAVSSYNPDFILLSVSNYPEKDTALSISQDELRKCWHRLFSIPDFNRMISHIPTFWMINDNETVESNTGSLPMESSENAAINEISHPSRVSDEQIPSLRSMDGKIPSYRTYRLNKDVQIWIMEERHIESPDNAIPPKKSSNSIKSDMVNWLKTSLKESNAAFRLIISQTPFINPFNPNNQTGIQGPGGYGAEKDSLFSWLKNNGFLNNGLYFICANDYLHYHSIDPSGFEEFSCGSPAEISHRTEYTKRDSADENFTNDIVPRFIQSETSGGFLIINSERDEYNSPVLVLRFFDEEKSLLYAVKKF